MLISRLKNQSKSTQTAYLRGENGGGLATEEGIERSDRFITSANVQYTNHRAILQVPSCSLY